MIDLTAYRPQIDAALARGGETHCFDDVVEAVRSGGMQAWVNGDTIAITEIIAYPRKKVLHCFLAGGNIDRVIEMMDSAAAWGRAHGCEAFTIAGRKGWVRALRAHGWKPTLYAMELPI
jgi:hypothetical protein